MAQTRAFPTLDRRRFTTLALAAAGAPLLTAARASAAGKPLAPSHGFNLPGWTDTDEGKAPSRPVLEKLARFGFRSIRLPIDGNPFAAGGSKASDAATRVRGALGLLTHAGYTVSADLHPSGALSDALENDPKRGADMVRSAWRALAPVVAEFPAGKVAAELLNEPPMEPDAWLALRDALAKAIRAQCPYHTLIWGPARYQGVWEFDGTPPLADDNAVAAAHYYSPMAFTHQCESWNDSPLARLKNLPFPARRDDPRVEALARELKANDDAKALKMLNDAFSDPWTPSAIESDFAGLSNWSERHGQTVILNEFGVLDFCADEKSRTAWIRAVRRAAERHGIGWTYWELDQGFGFIEDRRSPEGFDRAVVKALLPNA
ncbi:glycoside hydrolase family 5 protein [Pararhizobium mangrovi]|uniref:glycoside hydrolase family 5 protein n=1 Tax=Pararhizobium mangrovi TaxID=2590452 RepID=UPI0015E8567E|nr:cellulase family glycosylhydrolase [Pararhizobium mangrovi]